MQQRRYTQTRRTITGRQDSLGLSKNAKQLTYARSIDQGLHVAGGRNAGDVHTGLVCKHEATMSVPNYRLLRRYIVVAEVITTDTMQHLPVLRRLTFTHSTPASDLEIYYIKSITCSTASDWRSPL